MRRLLHFLFPVAALTIALMGSSRAEAPNLAVCKDGVCSMSEQDYRNLQAFAKRLRDYATHAQAMDEQNEAAFEMAVRRAQSCEAWRADHRTSWKR